MFKSVIFIIITSVITLTGYCQDDKNLKDIMSNLKLFDNDPKSRATPVFIYVDFSDIAENILSNNKSSDVEALVITKLKTLNPNDILYCALLNYMRTALGENTIDLLKDDKFMPTSMGGNETVNRIIIPLTQKRLNFIAQMKKTQPSSPLEELVAERVIEYPAVDFATEWHHPDLYRLFSRVEKFVMLTSDGQTIWVRCYFLADELRSKNVFNDKIEVSLEENGKYLFVYKLNMPKWSDIIPSNPGNNNSVQDDDDKNFILEELKKARRRNNDDL